jgi:hypothetical protein
VVKKSFTAWIRLSRIHSVKKIHNHGWTRMNTDEEMSEARSGLVFRRLLNGALSGRWENHVFIRVYLCPSVVEMASC